MVLRQKSIGTQVLTDNAQLAAGGLTPPCAALSPRSWSDPTNIWSVRKGIKNKESV